MKDDINLQDQILNTKQNLGKKKKELTFTSTTNIDVKKANVLLKELEEETVVENLKEKPDFVAALTKTPKEKKGKTKLVTLSTTHEVILMEEELKEIYERNGSIIPFNRSAIYKLGLKTILNENKKAEEIRLKYDKI